MITHLRCFSTLHSDLFPTFLNLSWAVWQLSISFTDQGHKEQKWHEQYSLPAVHETAQKVARRTPCLTKALLAMEWACAFPGNVNNTQFRLRRSEMEPENLHFLIASCHCWHSWCLHHTQCSKALRDLWSPWAQGGNEKSYPTMTPPLWSACISTHKW